MSILSEPHFHNEEAAFAKLEGIVWPGGEPVCPRGCWWLGPNYQGQWPAKLGFIAVALASGNSPARSAPSLSVPTCRCTSGCRRRTCWGPARKASAPISFIGRSGLRTKPLGSWRIGFARHARTNSRPPSRLAAAERRLNLTRRMLAAKRRTSTGASATRPTTSAALAKKRCLLLSSAVAKVRSHHVPNVSAKTLAADHRCADLAEATRTISDDGGARARHGESPNIIRSTTASANMFAETFTRTRLKVTSR